MPYTHYYRKIGFWSWWDDELSPEEREMLRSAQERDTWFLPHYYDEETLLMLAEFRRQHTEGKS